MQIELIAPACLHLGMVRAGQSDAAIGELGIALQYPQVQLVARPATFLTVSGARAELAYQQAQGIGLVSEIEIETAIPAHMGLGSDEMLYASMKRVQTQLHDTHTSFRMTLPQRVFAQGGLVLNDDDGLLRERATLPEGNEDEDWVFVLVLPREPDDIADDFETQQLMTLRRAALHLSPTTYATDLFAAAERRDFLAFAKNLDEIHAANISALSASGHPIEMTDVERNVLDLMAANGATISHRALTGLGLYGLTKGGPASRKLRAVLTQQLTYFGPLVMATLCDNEGARIKSS